MNMVEREGDLRFSLLKGGKGMPPLEKGEDGSQRFVFGRLEGDGGRLGNRRRQQAKRRKQRSTSVSPEFPRTRIHVLRKIVEGRLGKAVFQK